MEPSTTKPTAPPPAAPAAPQASTAQPPSRPPSRPPSQAVPNTEPKTSTSNDAPGSETPPFSPTSQTPVLQKEQEEFEGTLDVNNDVPSEKDLKRVEDLLVLDAKGQSRPFKELYMAPLVAPRQLVIFIRHFFCGVSKCLDAPVCARAPETLANTLRTARNISAPSRPRSSLTTCLRYLHRPS